MAPKLRVCMSCEWIWVWVAVDGVPTPKCCPKCGMGSYGARAVYGDGAYKHAKTQAPWMSRKVELYQRQLLNEIRLSAGEIMRRRKAK